MPKYDLKTSDPVLGDPREIPNASKSRCQQFLSNNVYRVKIDYQENALKFANWQGLGGFFYVRKKCNDTCFWKKKSSFFDKHAQNNIQNQFLSQITKIIPCNRIWLRQSNFTHDLDDKTWKNTTMKWKINWKKSLNPTEAVAEIIEAPDLHIDEGSTLRLECKLKRATESPLYVFW